MEKTLSKNRYKHLHEFDWYTVQIIPGHEDKVCKLIASGLESEGMSKYIKEVLSPTQTISEVRRGKKITMSRKLYPGYIFIHMMLYDVQGNILQEPWYFLHDKNRIKSLIRIVGGDRPLPLSETESQHMLDKVKAAEGKELPKVQYTEGETVKIMHGPFLDMLGTVEKVDIERGKLKVLVSMFGRSTPLEFEYWQVQKNV